MKTYTRLLDVLILSLILLAVKFIITDECISDSVTNRRGVVHMMTISWQSLVVVAGFCAFLQYIARHVR